MSPIVVDKLPEGMLAASVNSLLPTENTRVILHFLTDNKKSITVVGYRIGDSWYGNYSDNLLCNTDQLPEGTIWSEVLLASYE